MLHSSLKQVEIFALKKEAILKQEDLTQERKDGLIKQVQWLSKSLSFLSVRTLIYFFLRRRPPINILRIENIYVEYSAIYVEYSIYQ